MRQLRSGSVSALIEAPSRDVYDVVADVTSIGQRSPECRSASWLPGKPAGQVGARFRGRNQSGIFRWSRVCEVIRADPGKEFTFRTVPEHLDLSRRDSITWAYLFTTDGTATRVTHAFEMTLPPLRLFAVIYRTLMPQHLDPRPAMRADLDMLKTLLESPPRPPVVE